MSAAGFTFDAVDPGYTAAKLFLVDKRVGLVPQVLNRVVQTTGRVWDFGSEFSERRIELSLVTGDNALLAGTDAAVRSIAQLFDPTREVGGDRGFKQLIFDSEPDRYWLAKLASDPTTEYWPGAGRLSLALRCADPFAYAIAVTVATGAVAVIGGLDVGLLDVGLLDIAPSVSLTVTTGGTYRTDAVIDVTMAGGYTGPLIVVNLTTGQWVSWNGTLAASDVFTVDGTTQRAYVNGVLSMSGVVSGSRWPQLLAAQGNSVQVLGPSPTLITSISVTYRNRWI